MDSIGMRQLRTNADLERILSRVSHRKLSLKIDFREIDKIFYEHKKSIPNKIVFGSGKW